MNPSSAGLPVGTELLLLLARTRLAPQAARRVRTLLAGEVDWIHLLGRAQGHGVLPLLYVQLRTIGDELVPRQILDSLGVNFAQHVGRNERLGAELVRLLTLLSVQSIAAVAVKGPALAVAAYGDLSLREFTDVDVLIHRSDALRAREVFVRTGYRLMGALDERGFPQDPESFQYSFLMEGERTVAELHWRFTPLHLRGSLDLEYLYRRCRSVTINGTAVPTPAPEETLLVLCVHGDHHQWALLKWVCDVAEVVRANPGLDWERVQIEARRLGCWRMVALGLQLASDLLDAPVPDRVRTLVQQDRRVSVIASRLRGQLLEEGQDDEARVGTRPYHPLQLLERSSDWVWNAVVLVRRLWTVTPNDKELIPLPTPLRIGYHPLRWGRVAWKYGVSPLLKRLRAGRLPPKG